MARYILYKFLFNIVYWFKAPWDIGRPQPVIKNLVKRGKIAGRVLDVGCGAGDTTIYLARKGYEVMGIDFVPRAIDITSRKAEKAGLNIPLLVHDALRLDELNEQFDTIIDAGLFHNLSDGNRKRYAESLASVLKRGGSYYMLCFSDTQGGLVGPRRISKEEIYSTFANGWDVRSIRKAKYRAYYPIGGAHAWIVSIRRN
jgi:cyclopropane fatty-acyl-phospholipid synthase-like methyltransferase